MTTPATIEPNRLGGVKINGLKSALAGPFDLAVARGGIVAISGDSGSGKTLFLRMIADLDPNEGEVTLNGVSRGDLTAPQWRARAPYVAAESGWWTDTALQHFQHEHLDRARVLAATLGVGTEQLEGPIGRLSTGERQRLALIRALVLEAPLLLLDEPTGPLDPRSVALVEAVLRKRALAGTTILLVTHDPKQGERLEAEQRRMMDRRLHSEP